MDTVQIAMSNAPYRQALRETLLRSGNWEVLVVDQPDLTREGVIAVDGDHLRRLPQPIPRPERVVLITRKDLNPMSWAWEAGVNSVVFEKDPMSTAVLAILSAKLRSPKALASSKSAPGGGRERG
jgi:hypothetical protein